MTNEMKLRLAYAEITRLKVNMVSRRPKMNLVIF